MVGFNRLNEVSRLSNHVLKAWNSATPVQGSGSLLLLVKTINRLFLKTSLVIVIFFCPLEHYPNLTYHLWGIKYISLNLVRYAV